MMSTRYALLALVTGIAALVFGVSLAGAGTPVDDYWRDGPPAVSRVPDTIVDDYFRDAPAASARAKTPAVNTVVDDYFRDAPIVATTSSGRFHWGDFGIGIAFAVGVMLLLAGLAVGVRAVRLNGANDSSTAGTL